MTRSPQPVNRRRHSIFRHDAVTLPRWPLPPTIFLTDWSRLAESVSPGFSRRAPVRMPMRRSPTMRQKRKHRSHRYQSLSVERVLLPALEK